MAVRCAALALALAWCACAAAPTRPTSFAPPSTSTPAPPLRTCERLLLRNPPPMPPHVREHEAAVAQTARTLSDMVEAGAADEVSAAALARVAAHAPLQPRPAAVALGAPQLHLGVLYRALPAPPRLFIFQQNNTVALQLFWRSLALAWNESAVVWSNAWFSCEEDGGSWWSAVAAARGAGGARAAAAIFRRLPAMPCEEAMYDWLGGPPTCDPATTNCQAVAVFGSSKRRLKYKCECRRGYRPAGQGCELCTPTGEGCDAPLSSYFRQSPNIAGMLLYFIIGIVVFKLRKCKAVAMGMWTVLEMIVFGALLLYASAASQSIEDARWRCIIGAWLRELGFIASYGSMVLRLWVLLAEFRTRKAHRWTPRDSEVLRVVGAMLAGCACYLAAFTATSACASGAGDAASCARSAWHHVTGIAELLLIVAGLRIARASRNANVPFQERGLLEVGLWMEGVCGAFWRLMAVAGSGPETSGVAATVRAQLSSAAVLVSVLLPRLMHVFRSRSLAQEVSRRGPAEGFSVEGEEEPTSEEVRAELKRLYVQLEILRNKTLRRDNPHISRRRGGRKPPHRRFSLQALQARRGNKNKPVANSSMAEASEAGDASRTPEDSVCSGEGPSHYTDGDQP